MKESLKRYTDELEQLRSSQNYRELRTLTHDGNWVEWNGKRMLNLSSNDYMGLSTFNPIPEENDLATSGMGSCSSRLLTGNDTAYTRLEETLKRMYHREESLVFNSGYHANLGILPALTTERDLILADKLVHASMIDGIRLSAAKCVRFPHNDLNFAERLLQRDRTKYDNVILVTESIFSMDGDVSDLCQLVKLKQRYDCLLYVDEAHAIGTHGANGLGMCEAKGVIGEVDLLLGTFGKAVASMGAFIACDSVLKNYLVNKCRPIIFSTALPPRSVDYTRRVMETLPRLEVKRAHLQQLSDRLRTGIEALGYKSSGCTHIVPLITGNADQAVALSDHLIRHGMLALPIRRPTVPAGGERIRFSLTATMTTEQIDLLLNEIENFQHPSI